MADPMWTAPGVEELAVLGRAAGILEERHLEFLPQTLADPLVALFRRTEWLGGLDLQMLSRLPCDEVIATAQAVVDVYRKISDSGGGEGR